MNTVKALSNMGMRQQLAWGFGIIVALVILLASTAWIRIGTTQEDFETLVDNTLPALTALSEVNDKLQIVRSIELQHLVALTMPAKDREELALNAAVQAFDGALQRYTAFSASSTTQSLQGELGSAVRKFHLARTTLLQMSNSAAGAETERAVEASDYFNGPGQQLFNDAYRAGQNLWQHHVKEAEEAKAQGQAVMASTNQWLASATIASILVAITLALFIPRHLMRQLGGDPTAVAHTAQTIAQGDLSSTIDVSHAASGSVVESMASMQQQLSVLIGSVQAAASESLRGTAEIASGSMDLSMRTELQASALEQTAASLAELNATVRQTASNADRANQLAKDASAVAAQGGEIVNQVVETMRGIDHSSRQVSEIITVIDAIAFQTNILALNAAVEAARAGTQGRGFAVVADEVRTLAGRSAQAAKEIKDLIQISVACVEQGNTQVNHAGAAMVNVVDAIRKVTTIAEEINVASGEQALGVAQVDAALRQMDQSTQQNAALVEQLAATAAGLRTSANEQVRLVSAFTLATNPSLA